MGFWPVPETDPAVLAADPAFTTAFVAGQTDAVITKSNRIPFSAVAELDGPTAVASGSSNTVGFVLNPSVVGDFTGIGGSDAGFWWGFNVFAFTGDAAGDAAGLTDLIGGLVEMAVRLPSGTIPVVIGLQSDVSLFGAAAGATITHAESMRVAAPKKKAGATGGSIVNAYGLFVEEVDEGTSSNFSLFVDGGVSRFGGRVDTAGTVTSTSGDLGLYAGFASSDGAKLGLSSNAAGGHVTADLLNSGAALRVKDGTNYVINLFRTGYVFLRDSSAPGTPTTGGHIYVESGALKYKGSSATVTTLAAA